MPQDALNNISQATGESILESPSQTPQTDKIVNEQEETAPPVPEGEQQKESEQIKPEDQGKKEDALEKAAESTGYTMDALSESWDKNKELPADAYESLAQAGYPRELVDQVCQKLELSNQLEATQKIASFQSDIASHVGGADVLENLIKYTDSPAFDPKVRAEIDSLINIDNPAAAKLAMEKVKSMYEKEFGKDGNPIGGAKNTGAVGDVFTSRSEQSKAFVKARNSGDNSLLKQVREKAARTSQHNRKTGTNWL